MKILPYMNAGMPIIIKKGDRVLIQIVPVQIWKSGDATNIRFGDNLLTFDSDGKFTGAEYQLGGVSDEDVKDFGRWLEVMEKNSGLAPEEAFHETDTKGWKREVAAWAYAKHQPIGPAYSVVFKDKKTN
jgi:hypothetical protein